MFLVGFKIANPAAVPACRASPTIFGSCRNTPKAADATHRSLMRLERAGQDLIVSVTPKKNPADGCTRNNSRHAGTKLTQRGLTV